MKLEIVDDELLWIDRTKDAVTSAPFEVFRPNERYARKVYKQLKELFEKK